MSLPSFNPKRYPELLLLLGGDSVAPEKRSLADEAHDGILLRIIQGDLPAGTELKTTLLARQLNMSRTPVIQALGRLTASGIVRQSLNLRAIVRKGAHNWLVDLHRMRQLIEPEAARHSTGHIPEEVLSDLQMLCQDAKPSRTHEWQPASRWFDMSLHLVVAEYCGNLSMRETIRRCWSYKSLSYEAGEDSTAHLKQGYKEHAAILDALTAGKADLAKKLMTDHLESAAPLKATQRIV